MLLIIYPTLRHPILRNDVTLLMRISTVGDKDQTHRNKRFLSEASRT